MRKDQKPYRILVMEDNPGDFAIVEELLGVSMASPSICHVETYREAVAALAPGHLPVDVILMDLSLPDKNGEELIKGVLSIAPSVPIIILTGHGEIQSGIRSISLGIFDYLVKDELSSVMLYKSIIYSIERSKNIAELKDSERRYSDIFHLSPIPMMVFDAETLQFIQVNEAATTLYGYSQKEFMEMTVLDLKVMGDSMDYAGLILSRGEEGSVFNQTVEHIKKSGESLMMEVVGIPIVINQKKYRSVICTDVTEKRLFETKLIKSIIETQEDERYEIGGELHDNVCQILAASYMSLSILKKALPPEALPDLETSGSYIQLALQEIRNLSHRLAPVFFGDSTMEEAFRRLFVPFETDGNFAVTVVFDEEVKDWPIPQDLQLNLYRILQEQLRNIVKYAQATTIDVNVFILDQRLAMMISDNGVGFDTESLTDGIGMANMKRRTELFSGKFDVRSSPGHGCELFINVPLPRLKLSA
ncbi:MAG: PAS domain S-box protein [Chitinophagaceae bacterium]